MTAVQETAERIKGMLREWEEGRNVSPSERDYVIGAVQVIGIDATDEELDRIANIVYEDMGETLDTVEAIARFILGQLTQTAARRLEEAKADTVKAILACRALGMPLREVADLAGVSREQVRRVEAAA